jgi:hypothetical protein
LGQCRGESLVQSLVLDVVDHPPRLRVAVLDLGYDNRSFEPVPSTSGPCALPPDVGAAAKLAEAVLAVVAQTLVTR